MMDELIIKPHAVDVNYFSSSVSFEHSVNKATKKKFQWTQLCLRLRRKTALSRLFSFHPFLQSVKPWKTFVELENRA